MRVNTEVTGKTHGQTPQSILKARVVSEIPYYLLESDGM